MAEFDDTQIDIAFGKELHYSDDGETGWIKVGGTVEIIVPERELGEAEYTNDDSTGYHKQFVPGLYDPGALTFTYKYTATQFAELEEVFMLAADAGTRADAMKYWRVTMPDGSTGIVRGYLRKHDLPTNIEEVPTVASEVRCNGPMAWDSSASG